MVKKWYVVGALSVLAVTSAVSYADEGLFNLSKMNCKVWLDGKEAVIEEPILNHNGKSYVPLRKISEITGAKVEWDNIEKIIKINQNTKEVVKEVVKEVPVVKEVIKEVPVVKEITKEVPVEKIVYKEVPVERLVYVTVPSGRPSSNNVDSAAYNAEVEKIKAKYEEMRNNARAENQLAIKRLKESNAARGIQSSAQGEITLNGQLQNTINQINLQEQQALNYLKALYGL
jgi:hypothetical protein